MLKIPMFWVTMVSVLSQGVGGRHSGTSSSIPHIMSQLIINLSERGSFNFPHVSNNRGFTAASVLVLNNEDDLSNIHHCLVGCLQSLQISSNQLISEISTT